MRKRFKLSTLQNSSIFKRDGYSNRLYVWCYRQEVPNT